MDSAGIRAATSKGDNLRHVKKKNRVWHKRQRLRKTAVQTPTMQSEDKRGPKKIAEGWKKSTVWPSSKKPPRGAQQSQHRAIDSGNTLRFTCSQCGDNLEYAPKDLVRHFEDKHKGSPPVFSCHTCSFSAHEFSYLQVHLLSHKDTFSSCIVCNDNVQRTWSEFSTHLIMYHCKNGKFACEMCHQFSTCDIRGFLEHVHKHNLGLDGANDGLSMRTRNKNKFGPKATPQILRCQHCGYEASQKWLIAKHMKAAHVSKSSNKRRGKEEVDTIAIKPNDPTPKIKPRLTRSAVREMCWLTQDCLSLPGREFLDKYCHLSDPQTTLEETQQFLMKSVAGETGDQKWTKALKTVLSNVPQDINLHQKSENGILSNSSDMTVLTVENKITVAQNGATYAKRLKMMTSSDMDRVSSASAPDDAHCLVDQSNLNDPPSCPQTETKQNNDLLLPAQDEPLERAQMQENRENQEVMTDQESEEHDRSQEGPLQEDGMDISSELKFTNESREQMSAYGAVPKNKRRKRRRKRKARSRKVDKTSSGVALKLVLKKNPVKEKQWVSQSSFSPSVSGPTGDSCGLLSPPRTSEDQTVQNVQNNTVLSEVDLKKETKTSETDLHNVSEAVTSITQSKPGEEQTHGCAVKTTETENVDGRAQVVQEMRDDTQKSEHFSVTEVDGSYTAAGTGQSDVKDADVIQAEVCPEKLPKTPGTGLDGHVSDDAIHSAADGLTSEGSCTKSSPVCQPVITPQGRTNSEDLSLALCSEQRERSVEVDGPTDDSYRDCLRNGNGTPAGQTLTQDTSPWTSPGGLRQLVPKTLERTLKLVAISPSQLVKRPARDQPVVVLNHPDADIPEVTRIMEVVNRYGGDAKRVALSRRTADALSARSQEVPEEVSDKTCTPSESKPHGRSSVQERFMLKLKLRRLTRKKYEVVGTVSPGMEEETSFRCWFCGRVFSSQETWMAHRQRHLAEWNRPHCENS